jgi:hypothetical protein
MVTEISEAAMQFLLFGHLARPRRHEATPHGTVAMNHRCSVVWVDAHTDLDPAVLGLDHIDERFDWHRHHATCWGGVKMSGRSACRGIPVSVSTRPANSAGTPAFDFRSQYETKDCGTPSFLPSFCCPPAFLMALARASRGVIHLKYQRIDKTATKTLMETADIFTAKTSLWRKK